MASRTKANASKTASAKKASPKKALANAKAKAEKAKAKPAAQREVKTAAPKAKPAAQLKAKAAAPKAKPAAQLKAKPAAQPKAKAAAAKAKAATIQKKAARQSSPAREARQAAAMKKAIEQVIAPVENDAAVVDAYMRDLDHPFKAEIAAVRAIILGASSKLSERIKWNAPSFFYKSDDLAAFNPSISEYAHLILMFPGGAGLPAKSSLLEGTAKDRREAKFHSLEDVQKKQRVLEKTVKDWLKLRDA